MAGHRVHGLVSIVVPVHNRRQYIRECLDSLAGQTYRPLEIIVVDDASTDQSIEVVRAWRRSQTELSKSEIQVIRLPHNVGYAGAMTVGMFAAKGQYIALQDSDDCSHRDRIQSQVRHLRRHRDVGLVGTSYRIVKSGEVHERKPDWLRFGYPAIRRTYAQGGHCISCGTILFRGRLFDQLGGMTRRIPGAEDYEFITRFLDSRIRIDNLRRALYYYRHHPNQRSHAFYGATANG